MKPDEKKEGYLYRVYRATEELNKRTILDLVPRLPGGRMLDCGCGDGDFTRRVADQAGVAEVHAIESVPWRARTARTLGVRATIADLDRPFPYTDGAFDLVHANQLIEHLRWPDRFLREIHRLLEPGALALLSTNNLASWHNVVSLALGMQPPPMHVSSEVILGNRFDPLRGRAVAEDEDTHLRLFSFQGFRELVEYHRFEVLDLRTAGFYPWPPRIARVLSKLDRRHGAFLIALLRRV